MRPQNVLETAVGSKTSKTSENFKCIRGLRGSTVANYFKLSLAGTSTIYYIVSSPREPRFCSCANTFASEAWPRPGLALETGPLSST